MLKADLHVHSAASYDAKHPLSALAQEAARRGLDAIAVCDHDCSTPAAGETGVLLIPGTEITTSTVHLLGLFLERPVDHAALGEYPDAARAAAEIHRCGGVAVLAHPFAPEKLPEDALRALRVDAVECANARAMHVPQANARARALAARMGLPETGGSDAHHKRELGGCCTYFFCEERTLPALRRALLEGKTQAAELRACPWRYKGLSLRRRARSLRQPKLIAQADVYLLAGLLRDAAQALRGQKGKK